MEQAQQLSTEKKKPGPKPKVKQEVIPESAAELTQMMKRIRMLEVCLERVATVTGNGNILMQFGLSRWIPGKKDLTKYSN